VHEKMHVHVTTEKKPHTIKHTKHTNSKKNRKNPLSTSGRDWLILQLWMDIRDHTTWILDTD